MPARRPLAPARPTLLWGLGAMLLPLLVAGCAVGPDFHRPAAPRADGYTPEPLRQETASAAVAGGEAQRFVRDMDIPGQWWTLFHSEPLNALIERALAANPDLDAAQAALRVAQENVLAQQGAYYPSIQASVSPSRSKTATGSVTAASASGSPYFSLYTAQVSVSYVVDVFGLNRRMVEGLAAEAELARYQLEATYVTLSANVVAAAVQEASLRGQIAATEEIIRLETELLELFRRQYALGQIAMADVASQEATLAAAEATLPPLRKQLAQQRNLLTALAGGFPSDEVEQRFELSTLELPQELPLSLPATLVEHRPDVRAAEASWHAASAQVGVAIANRLPNITLTAAAGSSAVEVDRLFTPGTGFWSWAATLTQPVFEGGALLHKQRAAEAAYRQAAAQYRGTVVTALRDVADTLRALQYDADAVKATARAERAAALSLEIARARLRLGEVSYLALLNAEQSYQAARLALVQAEAGRYADTAALFLALGGGWWNRAAGGATETGRD